MRIIKKAILPAGFAANGINCGLKKSGKPDLAVFYSVVRAKAAGMFTTNKIASPAVALCKSYLKSGKGFHAVIANSGNANCFTGKQGMSDAVKVTAESGKIFKIGKSAVFPASTGIIGKRLDVTKITKALPGLISGASAAGIEKAKLAIMTTDKFPKEVTAKLKIGGKVVTICGVGKGVGMISPKMATMLVFIFTDAAISQRALKKSLTGAVERSFNCITVDGCMSTNDTVILMANSCAGNKIITETANFRPFSAALDIICLELAKLMVKDGEGASKLIEIRVKGARNGSQAKSAALAVANSNLFKTAIYGENPNFGRVVAAVGASGAEVKEEKLKVKLGPLNKKEVRVDVDLGLGKGGCVVYTSDLTPEYIKINAAYN
ncbi:MAG: bifunctional glutamate N-acetyltransferase/amino-acid acetyltransferase ArgJ [Candidatus Omnitrophica bacterium]|nr:bifunctional glutamate N-acetyltransferase/amino-acid acetyltransferase ArgJ [Candidatus Omnitrophota bacterium]MDD5078905.1 bifunctional glutamate N-acetyltransferase/amino-acid acetyltransferase ArgJ [Candidatus Omnitrophota bacterium]